MKTTRRNHRESGSALVFAVLFMLALGGMAASLAVLSGSVHREHERARGETKSFYAAEAGLQEAYATLLEGAEPALQATLYPRSLANLDYDVVTAFGETDPDLRLDRIRLQSVGDAGAGPEGVQLVVWKVPTGFFRWAAFGDESVLLNSNVLIDSYDSGDGPYPTGVPFVGDYGNVGSNGDITIDANVEALGDVMVGPAGVLDDSAPGIDIAGTVGSNPVAEDMEVIVVPTIATSGSLTVNGSTLLPPGDHHFDAIVVEGGGRLTIEGPARLVVDDMLLRSNADWVIDATGGPVEVFGTGDFDLRSNSSISTSSARARDVSVMLTGTTSGPGASTIALNSNSDFTGTIYAPDADLVLESNFALFGAVRADSVELASNAQLHFDEDLLYDPAAPPVFERVSWRRLSKQEVAALGF